MFFLCMAKKEKELSPEEQRKEIVKKTLERKLSQDEVKEKKKHIIELYLEISPQTTWCCPDLTQPPSRPARNSAGNKSR